MVEFWAANQVAILVVGGFVAFLVFMKKRKKSVGGSNPNPNPGHGGEDGPTFPPK